MFVQFCFVLVALSSLAAASEPSCEELTKPLEDQTRVTGKWIFYAGSMDPEEQMKELRALNSSWIEISAISDSDEMTLHWVDKIDGKCIHGEVNYTTTIGNATKVTFSFNSTTHEHVGEHLVTCPDCILWVDNSVRLEKNGQTTKARNLYLFTKTGALAAADLEHFKKQAACLGFPQEFHFGEATDLCPPDPQTTEEEQ